MNARDYEVILSGQDLADFLDGNEDYMNQHCMP